MKVTALINTHSGSVPADAADEVRAAGDESGHAIDVVVVEPEQLKTSIREAIAGSPDLLVVWGGDGSIACALDHAGPIGLPVLPLPGGTMNLLPKQVHGGLQPWRDCLLAGLSSGKETFINAGSIDGKHSFYVGALVGELASLSRAREAIREGRPIAAMEEASETAAFDLETNLAFHELRNHEPGESVQATALAAFVPEMGEGFLEVGWIDPANLVELMGLGLEIALGDWRSADGVAYKQWESLRVFHAHDLKIEATLDGEPVEIPSGALISFIPKAARVVSARGS